MQHPHALPLPHQSRKITVLLFWGNCIRRQSCKNTSSSPYIPQSTLYFTKLMQRCRKFFFSLQEQSKNCTFSSFRPSSPIPRTFAAFAPTALFRLMPRAFPCPCLRLRLSFSFSFATDLFDNTASATLFGPGSQITPEPLPDPRPDGGTAPADAGPLPRSSRDGTASRTSSPGRPSPSPLGFRIGRSQ